MTNVLTFKSHAITPIIIKNQPYLRVSQIETALQYQAGKIRQIYNRHADEFTLDMSFLTTVDTNGGKQQIRVFSLRGCHLLAMFSKTPIAKEFRKWVLDLIERQSLPEKPVIVSEHTRALPSGKKEIVLSEKARSEIGGIFKACLPGIIREEAEKLSQDMIYSEKFKQLVREAIREELQLDPAQWPGQDWQLTAHHAIDEICH